MDDTRRELLRSWLTKAASDLRSARVLGSADDAPLDTAIYHCQQTAEKAVKAFLVSKEISPEKTHDIRKLTLEAAVHEPRFNEVMDMAVSLTPYAWEFRYPDDLAETYPTREEFDENFATRPSHLRFRVEPAPGGSATVKEVQCVRACRVRRLAGCNSHLCSRRLFHYACSMKITENVRKYAAEQGIAEAEALKNGMEEKSREFTEKGSELYARA